MAKSVIIVGGGLAGLAAACRLAHHGVQVSLYEQQPTLGGKLGELSHAGFRFDIGPTLLTMPFVIDELFASLGKTRSEYLTFLPLSHMCRYFYADGSVLDSYSDLDRFDDEIGRLSPGDRGALHRFLTYSKRIFNLTAHSFLYAPIHEPSSWFTRQNMATLLRLCHIDPLVSVHRGVSRFFNDARLKQLFDRYATYNGSNPYQAPATLNIIPYVEYGLGGYYIQGGMYRLVEALSRLALENGATLFTGKRVTKILVSRNKAQGVVVDGEKIAADYVLCNGDVTESFAALLPEYNKEVEHWRRCEPSLSGLMFLWGVHGRHEQLTQHNILFSADYRSEFEQLFRLGQPPSDPTIYIAISGKSQVLDAPPQSENWFVLINMPWLRAGQNWRTIAESMRGLVLRRLQQQGLDLNGKIGFEHIITPQDLQERLSSNRGSIYGLASNSRLAAFARPANRNRSIKGLYFAGGSAHPGGGVPLVMLSGKLAAELLLEDMHRNG
jgi:phytoene desaturase